MIMIFALVWCHALGSSSHPAQACLSYGGQPTFPSLEECQAYAAPLEQRIAPRTPKHATLTVECIARDISGLKATGETIGAKQRSKVDPLMAHTGGLPGAAAIAKIESTSPSASGPNLPLPAQARPKHEKPTKARNATQAAAELPPPPAESPPLPPAEPAAQPGNPLLRALGTPSRAVDHRGF
jgi:hypothetical protein